jgi:hypothetical protein
MEHARRQTRTATRSQERENEAKEKPREDSESAAACGRRPSRASKSWLPPATTCNSTLLYSLNPRPYLSATLNSPPVRGAFLRGQRDRRWRCEQSRPLLGLGWTRDNEQEYQRRLHAVGNATEGFGWMRRGASGCCFAAKGGLKGKARVLGN